MRTLRTLALFLTVVSCGLGLSAAAMTDTNGDLDLDRQEQDMREAPPSSSAATMPPSSIRNITLYILRHAQGEHNVHGIHLPDPPLTRPQGTTQATDIGKVLRGEKASGWPSSREAPFLSTEGTRFPTPDLVLVSPLRRTIETTLRAFEPTDQKFILLPELQELHDKPCDIGSDVDGVLERVLSSNPAWASAQRRAEIKARFDTQYCTPKWFDKGPEPDTETRGAARAQLLRKRLHQLLAQKYPDAQNVVLVTHGGIMRHLLFKGSLTVRNLHHAEVMRCEAQLLDSSGLTEPVCNMVPYALPPTISR